MLGNKDPAALKVQEWWNQDKKLDPFSRAANETVSVEIASTNQISESAWQVDWKETIRDRDGNLKEPVVRMRAVLNVYTVPLGRGATEAEIARNPLGIFVRDFNWTRTT
jgi:type IV secretory pathway TrbF-like protein